MKIEPVSTCVPSRTFAEMPFCKSWREIRSHLHTLAGVKDVAFIPVHRTAGQAATLAFQFEGFDFYVQDRSEVLAFSLTDPDGSEPALLAVAHHFSEFLTPDVRAG